MKRHTDDFRQRVKRLSDSLAADKESEGGGIRQRLRRTQAFYETRTHEVMWARWAVLQGLLRHSQEFKDRAENMAREYRILLKVSLSEIDELGFILLEADDLPKRQRPPKEWRQARPFEYQVAIRRLCWDFGLVHDWIDSLHHALREKCHPDDPGFPLYLERPTRGLPWGVPYPGAVGRRALHMREDESLQDWRSEMEALGCAVAQAIEDWPWNDIAEAFNNAMGWEDSDEITTDPVTAESIRVRVSRLAKYLAILLP